MSARPALLVALAGCVLAGCAAVPTPPVQRSIEGRLVGPAAGTLAAPAEWVVELRDDSAERVLAEQRGAVSATQPPIAFVLRPDAARIAAAHRHSLRAALRVQGQVQWLSEPQPLELHAARIDVGSLRLRPYTHPGGFASTLDCGGRRFVIGYVGDGLRLSDGAQVHELEAVAGRRPARFERPGEPSTYVELDDGGATVSLQGTSLPRCVASALRP